MCIHTLGALPLFPLAGVGYALEIAEPSPWEAPGLAATALCKCVLAQAWAERARAALRHAVCGICSLPTDGLIRERNAKTMKKKNELTNDYERLAKSPRLRRTRKKTTPNLQSPRRDRRLIFHYRFQNQARIYQATPVRWDDNTLERRKFAFTFCFSIRVTLFFFSPSPFLERHLPQSLFERRPSPPTRRAMRYYSCPVSILCLARQSCQCAMGRRG